MQTCFFGRHVQFHAKMIIKIALCFSSFRVLILKINGLRTFWHSIIDEFKSWKVLVYVLTCSECEVLPEASPRKMRREHLKCEKRPTNSGDNSPSKEERGTDVPEALLIGWVSWRVHTFSDCWNHLLEREEKRKQEKRKVTHDAESPGGSVVWGGQRNIWKLVLINFLRGHRWQPR